MTVRAVPFWLNLLLFAVAAVVIWRSGTRLERLTDTIARRTGMGQGFAGVVLLAGATSLPEIATTVSAVLAGNVELAVHNLLGGVAFQVVVLAIADAVRRGPLTRFAPSFGLLLQGVGVVLMLGVAAGGLVLAGDVQWAVPAGPLDVGVNPVMLALPVAYLGVAALTRRSSGSSAWRPVDLPEQAGPEQPDPADERGTRRVWLAFAGFAALVLVGGWAAATIADVLAVQSGLGAGFVGATLLAAATSLPEISTTTSAVRRGNEELAVSNIFGSNAFDVALLAPASLMAAGAFPGSGASSAAFLGLLTIVLTCIYVLGLLERWDRSFARLGIDSIAVVVLYLAGLAAVHALG